MSETKTIEATAHDEAMALAIIEVRPSPAAMTLAMVALAAGSIEDHGSFERTEIEVRRLGGYDWKLTLERKESAK